MLISGNGVAESRNSSWASAAGSGEWGVRGWRSQSLQGLSCTVRYMGGSGQRVTWSAFKESCIGNGSSVEEGAKYPNYYSNPSRGWWLLGREVTGGMVDVAGFLIPIKFSFFLLFICICFFITKARSIFRHTKDAHQNMCQEQYSMIKKWTSKLSYS